MSDVPEGYRMSEVGVIPEKWEVISFGDNLNIISGFGFNKSEYVGYGIKLLRIDNVSYGEITWESMAFLPIKYRNKHPNLIIYTDDILLALNRPITNGKLKIAIVQPKDTPCILYQRVGKIIILNNSYNKIFAYYLLSKFIKKFVEESSVGSDQPFISTVNLKKIKIPLPPPLEQQAIASALSDVDSLITALEQHITKKRNIKQGAMQQLLTGKKRLPGFGGEWEMKAIGKEIDLLTGFPFPSSQYSSCGIKLLRGSNIKRGVTDWSDDITEFWEEITPNLKNYTLNEGDIVIAMDGSLVGRSFAILSKKDLPALLLQRVARIRSNKIDVGYLKEFICSDYFSKYCDSIKTVTAIPHISPGDIRNFTILLPPSKEEQQAIAQILTDMDTEIESLKQKRNKYKAIKQGMMQELLTGKTRLL